MKFDETKSGDDERSFRETNLDLIAGLQSLDERKYRDSFDAFCRNYWKPVYAYVRAAWAKQNEEAKDLTQAFFLSLAEGDALRRFEPERGSLRKYLRVLLRSFIGHHEVHVGRIKRGGAAKTVSLDAGPLELEDLGPGSGASDPEVLYERTWRSTIVNNALRELQRRCSRDGRLVAYQIFTEFSLTPEGVRPTYRDLATRYRLQEQNVKNHLLQMRDELRREVRQELRRLAAHDGEAEDEWSLLFGE